MVHMADCPFECGWSTDELMSDPELAAVEGGADPLMRRANPP